MLFEYATRARLLLQDQQFAVVNEQDLRAFINMARGQLAGQAECIRVAATLAVTAASQVYAFSSISLGGLTSVQVAINVRQVSYDIGDGEAVLTSRPFPWFKSFVMGQVVPEASSPSVWSQFAQGAGGSLYVNLLDGAYTLNLDVVALPVDLTTDATAEAIPRLWTDAVPFGAAYFAALTLGDKERAGMFWGEFEKFIGRGREFATPGVLSGNFAQAPDPFRDNRLGLPQGRGQR